MKVTIAALTLALASQGFSDVVVCESGGVTISDPVSCSLGPITSTIFPGGASTSGNVFTAVRYAETDYNPNFMVSSQTTGSASFSDSFIVPSSPASDVFKITIFISTDSEQNSSSGPLQAEVGLGFGESGFPPLDYNSLNEFDNCHHLGCSFQLTAPASAYTLINLFGDESFETPGYPFPGGADTGAGAIISRFASDGVTPDPFTPEPATAGLAGGAILVLLAAAYLKRRRKTMAYF